MNIEKILNKTSEILNTKIKEIFLRNKENHPGILNLLDSMSYCSLSGGKRIRPFLTIEVAKIFGVEINSSLETAIAIELIHTYSLIHDDLPCIDDDSIRRNQPSCHMKYNEATAVLTGDALLTFAFEILSSQSAHKDPNKRCELINSIAKSAGFKGMIGGQLADLESIKNKEINIEQISDIQKMKTGEMFSVSCEAGAIMGYADQNSQDSIKQYGYNLGMIFQAIDDIKDLEQDKKLSKATVATLLDAENLKNYIENLSEKALKNLDRFETKATNLRELIEYIQKKI